jgi:hypothetical protein
MLIIIAALIYKRERKRKAINTKPLLSRFYYTCRELLPALKFPQRKFKEEIFCEIKN